MITTARARIAFNTVVVIRLSFHLAYVAYYLIHVRSERELFRFHRASPEPDTLYCQSHSLPSPEGPRMFQIDDFNCVVALHIEPPGFSFWHRVPRVRFGTESFGSTILWRESFGTTMLGE